MSLIRGGGYGGYGYGSRRHEPSHAQIWNSPQDEAQLQSAVTSSHIEWKDTPEAHVYKVHLPALRPDEVKVEVVEEERAVIITGEKKMDMVFKGMCDPMEPSTGRMVRRLNLPENGKMSHVKAYMDNGVLTVTVPKYEVAYYYVYNHAGRPSLIKMSGN